MSGIGLHAVSPKRIQLRRTKGWRIPEGAVIVDRRSKWGNWYKPVKIGDLYVEKYRAHLPDPNAWVVIKLDKRGGRDGPQWGGFANQAEATAFAVDLHRRSMLATRVDLDGLNDHEFYLKDLRGKDLACWCSLDAPCHADTLLELANLDEVAP